MPDDDERLADLQIDPSFPEIPPSAPFELPSWTSSPNIDDQPWIREGIVNVPNDLFCRACIGSHNGPWIAVHGYMDSDKQSTHRKVFGFLTAILVKPKEVDRLVNALNTKEYPGNMWIPGQPQDHYTFAGEIPWHPEFGRRCSGDNPAQLYMDTIPVKGERPIEVEILAHDYAFESYHSALNRAGGSYIPSKTFSNYFDLRSIPQSFNQAQSDGRLASISLGAPTGFKGDLLYLRDDLLFEYAAGRSLVWIMWGERDISPYPDPEPEWLIKSFQAHANIWRYVIKGDELSKTFILKNKTGSRPHAQKNVIKIKGRKK